jgi:hypothetical protein
METELIIGSIEKSVLKNRYTIGRHIDSGSNGQIYKVTDS